LVRAVCLPEDAVELRFLDMDAPDDGGQRQDDTCQQRQPVPERRAEAGEDQQ
jgi:hypothetical protein